MIYFSCSALIFLFLDILQQGNIPENLAENAVARINEDLAMGRAARQNLIHNVFRHRM